MRCWISILEQISNFCLIESHIKACTSLSYLQVNVWQRKVLKTICTHFNPLLYEFLRFMGQWCLVKHWALIKLNCQNDQYQSYSSKSSDPMNKTDTLSDKNKKLLNLFKCEWFICWRLIFRWERSFLNPTCHKIFIISSELINYTRTWILGAQYVLYSYEFNVSCKRSRRNLSLFCF